MGDLARQKIIDLEGALLQQPDCKFQDDMDYVHWFAPGIYVRQITIPANMALTTMVHASENIAIISKGRLTIFADGKTETVEASHTMITKVGTKRAIYTHSEVVFTTIHANPDNETDIEKLVERLTFKDEETYQATLRLKESET